MLVSTVLLMAGSGPEVFNFAAMGTSKWNIKSHPNVDWSSVISRWTIYSWGIQLCIHHVGLSLVLLPFTLVLLYYQSEQGHMGLLWMPRDPTLSVSGPPSASDLHGMYESPRYPKYNVTQGKNCIKRTLLRLYKSGNASFSCVSLNINVVHRIGQGSCGKKQYVVM